MGDTQEELGAISKLLGKLTTKSVPSWDISEKGSSIKAHIRRFENAIGGATDLSDKEKAREFIATMRGSAAIFVEELSKEIKESYEKLKEELLSTFHKEKSVSMMMKEFNASRWKKNKQSIREFAAVLNIMWRKIEGAADNTAKTNDKTSEAILKNRLLDAIKEADPKFGSSLEFFITDATLTFKELATKAELKYDLYKENSERIAESEWDKDLMFLNAESQNKENQNPDEKKSFRRDYQYYGNQGRPRYEKYNNRFFPWDRYDGQRNWVERENTRNWNRNTNQNWRDRHPRDWPRRPAIGYDRNQFQKSQTYRQNEYSGYRGHPEDQRGNNSREKKDSTRYQNQQEHDRYRRTDKYNDRSKEQVNMNPQRTQGTVVKRTENVQFLEGKESAKNTKNL